MAASLSTEQLLLLNNLMYMGETPPLQNIKNIDVQDNYTIEKFINSIDVNGFNSNAEYGTGRTAEEWKDIIQAIKNDEQLMNMEIVAVHTDTAEGGGNGVSAVFADPSTDEAVVTFKGTVGAEWKDNFIGGGPTDAADGVSTQQQENALDWYQSLDLDQYDTVTVTGHSKGGNKAKYITLLDDSVDRCVSFDGQGFSDEFVEKYQHQIGKNQDKITNHNVEADYVNMLLNDIGETTYYEAHNIGKLGFLENHCPNSFFKFNEDGSFELQVGERNEMIAEIDKFLNSYLRSLSSEEKAEMLELVGELVEMGFNEATIDEILQTFLDNENSEQVSNLLAYLLEYSAKNEGFQNTIVDFLNEMGIDSSVVSFIFDILAWEYSDEMLAVLSSGIASWEWLIEKIQEFAAKYGINLSQDDIQKLLGLIQQISTERDKVVISDNGEDKKVDSIVCGKCELMISLDRINGINENFNRCFGRLNEYATRVNEIASRLRSHEIMMKILLKNLGEQLKSEAVIVKTLENVLEDSEKKYRVCEQSLLKDFR